MRAALVVMLVAATPARADRCTPTPWRALQGRISPAHACNVALVTSDIDQGKGLVHWNGPVPADARIALTLQRLDARTGPLQIEVAGGWLLLDVGRFGFFTSEAAWAQTGWRAMPAPLAARKLADPVQLEIVIAGKTVTASIAGQMLGTWTVADRQDAGVLEVAFTAPRGTRSRIAVSAWSVAPR